MTLAHALQQAYSERVSSRAGGPEFQPLRELLSDGTAVLANDGAASRSTNDPARPAVQPPLRPAGPPVNLPKVPGGTAAFADSETFRWVRRSVAVAVPILAVNTVFTAFADNMPAFHHVAALIAVPVMVAAWVVELSGVRWPRLALIAR